MRRCDRGQQHINPPNMKGRIENGSPLPRPASWPFPLLGPRESQAAERAEVSAGRSAASAAAAVSDPCLEAVRFRPGPAGARGCPVWIVRLGSVRVSWGARSSFLP